MDSEYQVLKLVNGITLVGNVSADPLDIIVREPLELLTKPIMKEDTCIGERVVLRAFLVMTDDTFIVLDRFNILTSNRLSEKLIPAYLDMVKRVYTNETEYDGSFLDGVDEPLSDALKGMSDDEKTYVNSMLDNIIKNSDDPDDGIIH